MRQLLVKSLLFFLLATAAVYSLGYYFINFDSLGLQSFQSLYESEKGSIDIIFLGNSHLIKGIDAEVIDAKCNTSSLNISVSETNIVEMYNNLKEVLTYQKPKLVVIECWPLIGGRTNYNKPIDNNFQIIYSQYNRVNYKKFGSVYLEELLMNNQPIEKNFALINNRYKWTDLKTWEKQSKYRDPKEYLQQNLKLMWSYDSMHIKKFDSIKDTFSAKNMFVSTVEEEYLLKVFELSETHNFEVLLLTVPVYESYYNLVREGFKKTQSQISTIAETYPRVSVIDLNKKFNGLDYTHILKEKDITDNQHLNYKGIILTSNETANYINENYSFIPKRKSKRGTPEKLLYDDQWQNFLSNEFIVVEKFQFKKVNKEDKLLITKPSNKNIRLDIRLPKTSRNNDLKLAFRKGPNFIYISNDLNKKKLDTSSIAKINFTISLQKTQLIKGIYDLILVEESATSTELLLHPIKQQLIIQ